LIFGYNEKRKEVASMSFIYSFPPVVDERARVLVAGTAPSVKSLEKVQFYGHPHNYFWRIVYALFQGLKPGDEGYGVPDPSYENRLSFLQNHRLALWDVIHSCAREGSLDVNIKSETASDIPGLLRRYPGIRCVAFNGSKAYDTFMKAHGADAAGGVALLKLPSSSPIPTRTMRNLDDRVAAWKAIVPFTEEP